ncbi:MAG: hypothetical protein ABSH14_13145 [Verrucomicrobiia bacterium]
MKAKRWIVIGTVASAAAVLTALAVPVATRTFRTTAAVTAVLQIADPLAPSTALLATLPLAGHDLVSYSLGTTNVLTNQVLALEINCDSSQANIVVYDKALHSNILVIATSTRIDALTSQDDPTAAGPNRERFVMQMGVNTNGFLIGGYVTVAGRVYLDPATGCPRALLKDTDKRWDKTFGEIVVKDLDDKTDKGKSIAGEAHLIGMVNSIVVGGSTNVFLLPFGHLTIKQQLLP